MIREIQLKDKEQWEELYRGYADFYLVKCFTIKLLALLII
jgi:hypothetical protein|tara:strand:+ start:80 stop:199 length:120 start_codon:yes stop_codon:yes gene_type:complete